MAQAIVLGASFGLLHAFDADHLATIGGLAARDAAQKSTGYAWRWALGHAIALGLVALAVLGLDAAGVLELSRYAELLVCVALLALGAQALHAAWRTVRPAAAGTLVPRAVREHVAGAAPGHLHFLAPWHTHARGRTSLFMGLLHGGAGSAAVLAVLPLTQLASGTARVLYLGCFSLGVAAGALLFARVFASLARRSAGAGERFAAAFQAAVGIAAVTSGLLLLLETLHGGG